MAKKILAGILVVGAITGLSVFIYLLTNNKIVIGYDKGYQPDQPLPFSHELHAGQYKINCQYCHANASVSRHATVPSLNICMNCHLTVATNRPAIKKLTEAYNKNEAIAWQKVHLLPDHVKFNHAAHVLAGKACQECHGPVETMKVVKQHASLAMGWCINCHRRPENHAPVTCGTCHY